MPNAIFPLWVVLLLALHTIDESCVDVIGVRWVKGIKVFWELWGWLEMGETENLGAGDWYCGLDFRSISNLSS